MIARRSKFYVEDVMSLETLSQLIQALAVVAGLVFAVVQVREFRRERERNSALELLHSFQTPEFARAMTLTYAMPTGLSNEEIAEHLGDDFYLVYAMTNTWESIGILVFRGEVELDMVGDFFSGPIILSWERLRNHFWSEREITGRATIGEWFEWLRDRLVEYEAETPAVAAHIEHRNWRPPR